MSKVAISEKDRAYLRAALRMNPVHESARCLDLRRRLLGRERTDQVDVESHEDRSKQRDALRRQINMVQSEFWKLPLDQLQRTLSAFDIRAFPEFAPVVNRLRTAAACRGEFPKLGQLPGMNVDLFNAFKSSVVLPPAEAARVKERFIRSIHDKKQLKEIQRGAKLIQKNYPILFVLEKDWFATIAKMKRRGAQIDYGATGENVADGLFDWAAEMPWYSWWGVILIIKLILAAIIH